MKKLTIMAVAEDRLEYKLLSHGPPATSPRLYLQIGQWVIFSQEHAGSYNLLLRWSCKAPL
jgi:hypothetical protein